MKNTTRYFISLRSEPYIIIVTVILENVRRNGSHRECGPRRTSETRRPSKRAYRVQMIPIRVDTVRGQIPSVRRSRFYGILFYFIGRRAFRSICIYVLRFEWKNGHCHRTPAGPSERCPSHRCRVDNYSGHTDPTLCTMASTERAD